MDTFDVDIAIIGSGFSGLGMAIRLKQEGIEDFTVLERGDDVGGTWHFNTYPGCACDVPSHLYSFSFAPNPGWSETYSRQPEIRDYLQRVADEHGIRPHVRLNCDVSGVEWDAGGWTVETSDGPLRARVVIAGMGPLAEPKTPPLEGLDRFEGEIFHSARWNHDYDLRGKRVAAVGTGASAIQFVPEIQQDVEQLHVIQRTPPWVMPHPNRTIRPWEQRLFARFPALQKLVRGGIYGGRETWVLGFVKNPKLAKIAERIARRHMKSQISDPELLEKVTPGYTIGCKRILPSNKWYPALSKPNVELLTGGVETVTANSIVTGDGEEREVDAIIFGTGFQVTDMPVGRHGARAGGQDPRRGLAGQPEGPPRRDRARLPEPVRAARPQHRARALLDGLHDRVAAGLRDGRAALHGSPRRRHGAGARGRGGALQRRPRRAHGGHGLEHRLRELVPRRDGPQRDAVAGLDLALPAAHRELRPRGLRARPSARPARPSR